MITVQGYAAMTWERCCGCGKAMVAGSSSDAAVIHNSFEVIVGPHVQFQVCGGCLRRLEDACYAAHQARLLQAEGATV